MHKRLATIITAAVCATAAITIAGTSRDIPLAIESGRTAITNTVLLVRGGAAIQRISVAAGPMEAGTTNTITIRALDGSVGLQLYSGALGPGGTATTYPRLSGNSNEAYVVQDVQILCTLNTTNAATIGPRVFIQSR